MHRRIIVYLLTSLLLLLLSGSVASAEDTKDVAIFGVGIVAVPSDIEVTDITVNGRKGTTLVVKDSDNWRANYITATDISNVGMDSFQKGFESSFIASIEKRGGKLLQSVPLKTSTIGEQKVLIANYKTLSGGLVYNVSAYFIERTDGVKIINITCADSEAKYWQPLNAKIVASVKG